MNPQFEQAQQLGNLWMEMATKMMSAGISTDPETPPPEAARRLRDASLDVMGQQADKYMRTPQFLEMIKQSLDGQIAFRKQLNEFFTQAHHGVQGVAKQDVEDLLLSIRHMETRVLDRVEGLCDRLEQLSRRLEALESDADPAGRNGDARRGSSSGEAAIEPGKE
jgi:hypothetical protein